MGFFNKIKTDNTTVQKPTVKSAVGVHKKAKKKTGLAQVLHESVFESVLTKLKENDLFIESNTSDGDTYIALSLAVQTIGGLDKKCCRDEAKGSIIELINSGRIASYITVDTLEANVLIILPNADTLLAMQEFSLLTNAEYNLCRIYQNSDIDILDAKVSFAEILNLHNADRSVVTLLKSKNVETLSDNEDVDMDAEEIDDNDVVNDVVDDSDENGSDVLSDDELSDMEMEDAAIDVEIDGALGSEDVALDDNIEVGEGLQSVDKVEEINSEDDSSHELSAYETAMQEQAVEQPEQEVPDEVVYNAVSRKYYGEGLNLEMSTAAFDNVYLSETNYVRFQEDREDGWLNNQLNERCKAANIELGRMREERIFALKNYYFRLLSKQCEGIQQRLDIHNLGTEYGKAYDSLVRRKEDQLANIKDEVDRLRAIEEDKWVKDLKEVGISAAKSAQQDYRERYGKAHQDRLDDIERQVRASIESDFIDEQEMLFNKRQSEASSLLNTAVDSVMRELEIMDEKISKIEQQRYMELDDELRQFIENNRENDVIQARISDERLKQSNEIEKLVNAQHVKLDGIRRDHEIQKQDLMNEIKKLNDDNKALSDRYSRELKVRSSENKSLNERYNDLMVRYEKLEKNKDKESSRRVKEQDAVIKDLEIAKSRLEEQSKKKWVMASIICGVVAVVGLTLGFISGTIVNENRYLQDKLDSYQQQVDKSAKDDAINKDDAIKIEENAQ